LPIPVSRELDHIKHQAIAQAARVRGIEFVAQEALFAIGALSDLEGRLIEMVPLAEPRFKAIVDVATAAMTAEVASVAGRYR
jgi:hypothetical protein